MDALDAKGYSYKDPNAYGAAPGPQVGVMAQDLQQAPGGAQMVTDTPQGKMVSPGGGFGVVLAALSTLNKKLKAFEQGAMSGPAGGVMRAAAPFGTPREWLSGEAFAPGGRFGQEEDLGTSVNRILDEQGSMKERTNTASDRESVATYDQPAAQAAELGRLRQSRTPQGQPLILEQITPEIERRGATTGYESAMATEQLPYEAGGPRYDEAAELDLLFDKPSPAAEDRKRRMEELLKLYGNIQKGAGAR
jgi:hypothetical protein